MKNVKAFCFDYFLCGVQKRLKFHFALIFFPRLQDIRDFFLIWLLYLVYPTIDLLFSFKPHFMVVKLVL